MSKNTILVLALGAALIVTGVVLFSRNNNDVTQQINEDIRSGAADENDAVVLYTDSGFSPANVTVPQGGSVIFLNSSSRSMWVASDPHPVHTDYPAFDGKRGVDTEGSYSFTFTQPGTWTYHNHLMPGDGGTVNVE